MKILHFLYVPWTGLGLYDGYRGDRWLKNRIEVFKHFVLPSLQAQENKNFTLLCSWRPQERNNPIVQDFMRYMEGISDFRTVHLFHGVLFYDDKYEDSVARERLITALHSSMGELVNVIGEVDEVYLTIQPSDDLYHVEAVKAIQEQLANPAYQAVGFAKGYICNYRTLEIAEYNPTTNPPFYTIKFPREVFIDPFKHCQYTSLKKDVGKYKKGTPIPSHEYVGDALTHASIQDRGFCVGVHGENISTGWDIPFKGALVEDRARELFGIENVAPLLLSYSIRKKILQKLPHPVRRKLRYWFGEKLYNFLRT